MLGSICTRQGNSEARVTRNKRPVGAAVAATDAESGTEGTYDVKAELRALDIMHKRGLIGADDYQRRRAEIEQD
jgi:hypothetical protein